MRANNFMQASSANDIRPYRKLLRFSLLLITLSEAKQTPQSWLRQSSSPAGEPKAGERSSPINCKVKVSDSINLDNQASNSRAAVFDKLFRGARERLAKQDARARIV